MIEQLEIIFNNSLDLIGIGNLDGYFTRINHSFERVLGYKEQEFLAKTFISFVASEDVEKTKAALQAASDGQQEILIENRYRCKDNSIKWIDWRVFVICENDQFVAVGRDITEKKQLELDLRKREKRYLNIIQTTSDGFIVSDENGRLEECNSAYLKMSGYTKDELLSLSLYDLDAVEERHETTGHINEIVNTGWDSFETKHRRKNGSTYDVEVRTKFIDSEKRFVAFIRDISQQKKNLALLQESEERFRQLSENIPEVFWLGSTDWQEIYYISPAYEKIWGKSCNELYENPLSWIESIVEEDFQKIRSYIPKDIDLVGPSIAFPEYRIKQPGGQIRWILARAFTIRNAEGKIYRIAGLAEDITERKKNEKTRDELIKNLQTSLDEVNTLSGLLPICASCKNIRDDKGYWKQVEAYIEERSGAQFTHSICPNCVKELYPDFVTRNKNIKP
ncbi:PAS domain S-box protein [Thermodesulfobacteriota bacterium]